MWNGRPEPTVYGLPFTPLAPAGSPLLRWKAYTSGRMPEARHGLGSGCTRAEEKTPRVVETVVDTSRQYGAEEPIVPGTETLMEAGKRGSEKTVSLASPAAPGAFLRALTSALRAHDKATGEHGERACALAARAAVELGLKDVARVRHAAVLHDVGKLCVPRSILRKPGRLSEMEWKIVRQHPALGADLLRSIPGFGPVRTAILAHHERFDGRGYPSGLAGTEIPVEARLICAVDAYDAMTSERPYRCALSHTEAIERLNLGAGTQFDPAVVEAVEGALG